MTKSRLSLTISWKDHRMRLPTLRWVKKQLRQNLIAPTRCAVLDVYVVGSVARGKSEPGDLDIALVVRPRRGKTSLQLSAEYHAKFEHERFYPRWADLRVDFQFFYPGETDRLSRIKLEP